MKINPLIMLLLFTMAMVACKKKTEDTYDEKLAGVQSAQAAFSTINKGDKASIKLIFAAQNGCGEFGRFEEAWSEDKTVLTVKVYVRYPASPDAVCTQVVKPISKIYEFSPPDSGEYTVRFVSGSAFVTQKITVL